MNVKAARRLARNKMIRHGLGLWSLNFVNSMRYAGLCTHSKKLISLSVEFTQAYTPAQLEQIVLHEIAHGLRGPVQDAEPHDDKWLKIARRIGYTGEATVPHDFPTPRIVWDVVCPSTGLILQVTERPSATTCKLCNTPSCTPITERRQIVSHKIHNIPAPPHIFAPLLARLKFLRPTS